MCYMQECVSKKKIGSGTGMKYARNVTVILHQLQYMILLIMHASVLSISWHRCVCACVRYGRSPEVHRPPAKCCCFSGRWQLWAIERVPGEVAAITLHVRLVVGEMVN